MTTTESNKLIAEFMGATGVPLYQPTEYEMYGIIESIPDGEDEQHFFLPKEMLFHTSWDWLMPVVEKIFSLGYDYTIKPRHMIIKERMGEVVSEYIGNDDIYSVAIQGESQVDVVYQAVIQFIKSNNNL